MRKVLHIIPISAANERLRFLGSTKDFRCRTHYFQARGIEYLELLVQRRTLDIIRRVARLNLPTFDTIILDIPKAYPLVLRYLRIVAPHAQLLFRSHNAEFPHRLEWMRASHGAVPKLRCAGHALTGLVKDILSLRYADYVLPICDADARQYWCRLGDQKKILNLPFFLTPEFTPIPCFPFQKKNFCVCITSVQINPLVLDAARNFIHFVRNLGNRHPEWRFSLTGNVEELNGIPPRVESTGILSSPYDILQQAKAVAILSDYGRGFKTKILEAIAANAYVLMTPKLYARQPEPVRPYCVPVAHGDQAAFERALEHCLEPFPGGDPNKVLRDEAFRALDRNLAPSNTIEAVGKK